MDLRSLHSIDCTGKRVLMRVDFNVDLQSLADQTESFRLTAVKKSVEYVLNFPGSTITFITHFGRPEGKPDSRYSVEPLVPVLEKILNGTVHFTADCLNPDDFSISRMALRENLRFHPGEEKNDKEFARTLSQGFDLYVNEAFSVCHRSHASIVAITEFLPSVAGFHLENEVTALREALLHPVRPAVAILGGAKIETKLPLIKIFEQNYDFVLLGGMIANEAQDQNIPFSDKVILPLDYRGQGRFDIGEQTILKFTAIINEAKTIVWNGPLGKFEEPPFDIGTTKIVEALARSQAHIVAGGGESLVAIKKAGAFDDINVVSTGGGAMLALLAGEKLPGLEALT